MATMACHICFATGLVLPHGPDLDGRWVPCTGFIDCEDGRGEVLSIAVCEKHRRELREASK